MKSPVLLLLTTLFLFGACKKSPRIPVNNMWKCHHKNDWSFTDSKENLVGTWDWEYIECEIDEMRGDYEMFAGLSVEFKDNGEVFVRQDGDVVSSGTWDLQPGDGDLLAMDTDAEIPQTGGRILFCGDVVEFESSFIDGCDNFFRKQP